MKREPLEYAKVSRVFAHDRDRVWSHIGDFGGIVGWVEGVLACEVSGNGVGTIRTVTMKGRQVRERLAGWDPAQCVIAYQILPPHSLPVSDILSTIEVSDDGSGSVVVTWRSQASFDDDVAQLRSAIEAFFKSSLDNLHRLLDRGI
jgi:hypothetical protein